MTAPEDGLDQYLAESVSVTHHALRAPRRRLVVILLTHRVLSWISNQAHPTNDRPSDTDVSTTARCLAKQIVAIEEGVSVEDATGASYKSSYNSLIQTHLPELSNVGAIRYDSDSKTVYPDQNLFALSVIVTVSSPVAQTVFRNVLADFYRAGGSSTKNTTGD